jgi:hypothetical protein
MSINNLDFKINRFGNNNNKNERHPFWNNNRVGPELMWKSPSSLERGCNNNNNGGDDNNSGGGAGVSSNNNNNDGRKKNEDDNNCCWWVYAARVSCLVALVPILFYGKNEKIAKYAAGMHLLTSPVTSFFIQHFSCTRTNISASVKTASCIMSGVGYVTGNCGAIIILLTGGGGDTWVNYLLTISLCMASIQFLMVLNKENVLRVMACTAGAVIVVTLAILGSFAPSHMSKRFFQSAILPFFLLFLETSRIW